MDSRIFLSPPHLEPRESELLLEAVASNWIAPIGPFVDRFEQALAHQAGRAHALGTSSGTAAIHLALMALGVGADDYVICQSLTFAGTVNPVRYVNAIPVFVDSETDTWNIDPDLTREAITWCIAQGRKPRAIIVVHLYGMPARMADLLALSEEFDIPIIEDAAEALGSTYRGEACGAFGALSVFSFNGNKIITTSGGGALLADDQPLLAMARHLATQARDPAPHYQHTSIGYNYRLSNLLAAVGCGQLEVLDRRVMARRRIFARYQSTLGVASALEWQPEASGSQANRWLTAATVAGSDEEARVTRDRLLQALGAQQIEARPVWKPMHLQPVFRGAPAFGGAVSSSLFDRGLCLPSGSRMTDGEVDRVSDVLRTAFGRYGG